VVLALVFAVPSFLALAGTPTFRTHPEREPSSTGVEFDPAACARLPGDERRLCDYGPLFNAAGEGSQIDPRLLAAVAYVESGYSADVIGCSRTSADGALGLMQFLPSTARERGVDPCDPTSAIFGAAKYLRDLHDQLAGLATATAGPSGAGRDQRRWELALAGYHAGPQAVRDAGGIPPGGATEAYVPRVMGKLEQYRSLFPSTGGIGGCPVAAPSGSTDPIETDNDHITPATQAMANAVIECFGRGGRPIWCYDERRGDGGRFEHPRGRACDFMITGGDTAEGDDRARGQAMAQFIADHAEELNVLYVIWYRRSWNPSDGDIPWERWRPYSGASPHTDHVHVSVRLLPGDPGWAACRPGISCSE
jgi:hypothetical protein